MSNCCTTQLPKNTGGNSANWCGKGMIKYWLTPTYANDGTKNAITLAGLDKDAIIALINHEDPSKRIYPTDKLENINNIRADINKETFDDQSSRKVSNGIRNITAFEAEGTPQKLGVFESFECLQMSFYGIDRADVLIGKDSADKLKLEPTEIEEGSFMAAWEAPKAPTQSARVHLTFDVATLEKDSDIRVVNGSSVDFSFLDRAFEGLYDLTVETVGTVTTTSVKIELNTIYQDALGNGIKALGWADTDFKIYNNTTAADVVVASAPESPDGNYTLTFVAQTSGDNLVITGSKTGYGIFTHEFVIP